MGRSHTKNGRRKDSKKGFKRKLLRHKTSWKTKNEMVIDTLRLEYVKVSNSVEDIKIRRLGWAGQIMRMEEERIPKKRF